MKKTTYLNPDAKNTGTNFNFSQLITIVALVLFFCFNANAQSNRMSSAIGQAASEDSVTSELSGSGPAINTNTFSVYSKYKQVAVKSQQVIASVSVTNLTGRTLFEASAINTLEYKTSVLDLPNQILMVRVTFANGSSALKKVHLN